MVEKEIWVHLLADNLIRVVMSGATAHAKTTVHHISFKHTVQFFFCIRFLKRECCCGGGECFGMLLHKYVSATGLEGWNLAA